MVHFCAAYVLIFVLVTEDFDAAHDMLISVSVMVDYDAVCVFISVGGGRL